MKYKKIKKNQLVKKAISHVIYNNGTPYLPYHNNQHLFKVFNVSLMLAKAENLSKKETIELALASLFHGFNHSGGKLVDNKNIIIAIDSFNEFANINERFLGDISTKTIVDLIRHTEYPKVKEPTTAQQKIIMDADIFHLNDADVMLSIIKGLADERGITIKQSVSDQAIFINNSSYYTSYAQSHFNSIKSDLLKKVKYFESIFN